MIKSKKQSDRLKNDPEYRRKLGTSKPSFMEDSFTQWVKTNFPNIIFDTQYPLKNEKKIGYYYADFYFPEIKLIIELDGNHHNLPEQIIHDSIRDTHLKSLGINILRITAKEYRDQSRVLEVIKILSSDGVEPSAQN